MHLPIIIFALIPVPNVPAMQANLPEQDSTPSIQGKVLQEPNAQPIRKASVALRGRKGPADAKYSAVTDAEGQFRIDHVEPGQYYVVVEHPGFVQSGTGRRPISVSVQPGGGKREAMPGLCFPLA